MSREDRQRRDREMSLKLKENSESRGIAKANKQARADQTESNSKALRPGDPGWVCRARVPMVENREYVQRPEWQSTVDIRLKLLFKYPPLLLSDLLKVLIVMLFLFLR